MKNVINGLSSLFKVCILSFSFFGGIVGSKKSLPVISDEWVMMYLATLVVCIIFVLLNWLARGRVVWERPSVFKPLLKLDEPIHLALFFTAYSSIGALGYVIGWVLLNDELFIYPYINSFAVVSLGMISGILFSDLVVRKKLIWQK